MSHISCEEWINKVLNRSAWMLDAKSPWEISDKILWNLNLEVFRKVRSVLQGKTNSDTAPGLRTVRHVGLQEAGVVFDVEHKKQASENNRWNQRCKYSLVEVRYTVLLFLSRQALCLSVCSIQLHLFLFLMSWLCLAELNTPSAACL